MARDSNVQGPLFEDTVVYESNLVRIGAFRCHRDYPGFNDTGPAQNDCFVFPRTAVCIEHEHEPAFAATPNVTTFYNRSQHYLRHAISDEGDRCDWFGLERNLAREAVLAVYPAAGEEPFPWTRGYCDAQTYFLQRRLFDGVVRGTITDPLIIDETVVLLLDRVSGGAAARRVSSKCGALVEEVERLLALRFDQPLTLSEIAGQSGVSVYHLCRTFHEATGYTLHQYLMQLRIRHGLESVCESERSLSRIAVDLGFSHHSHFTQTFRREFGTTPSRLRLS